MNVKLYVNASDPNVVYKTLSSEDIRTVRLLDDTERRTPVLEMSGTLGNFNGYNYLYIPDFDRYYFITEMKYNEQGLIEISCKCDTLSSFWQDIKTLSGVVQRQENRINSYMEDKNIPAILPSRIQTKKFPKVFTTGMSYYLLVSNLDTEE